MHFFKSSIFLESILLVHCDMMANRQKYNRQKHTRCTYVSMIMIKCVFVSIVHMCRCTFICYWMCFLFVWVFFCQNGCTYVIYFLFEKYFFYDMTKHTHEIKTDKNTTTKLTKVKRVYFCRLFFCRYDILSELKIIVLHICKMFWNQHIILIFNAVSWR